MNPGPLHVFQLAVKAAALDWCLNFKMADAGDLLDRKKIISGGINFTITNN